jgi:hypothetical protein
MKFIPALIVSACLAVCPSAASAALILGQVQTFDDPHGWVIGAGPAVGSPIPVPVADGGPAGAGDTYLSIVATGGDGPGSRLSAQNFGEWAGDYLAAGIDVIEMDVNNVGPDDVFLRLLFLGDFGLMGPQNAALTTNAVLVPAGSGWQRIAIAIGPADLTLLLGSISGALSNAEEVRIFHNPNPSFIPGMNPAVTARLGVDNITAAASAAAPEPATWMLLALAASVALRARRRRS